MTRFSKTMLYGKLWWLEMLNLHIFQVCPFTLYLMECVWVYKNKTCIYLWKDACISPWQKGLVFHGAASVWDLHQNKVCISSLKLYLYLTILKGSYILCSSNSSLCFITVQMELVSHHSQMVFYLSNQHNMGLNLAIQT